MGRIVEQGDNSAQLGCPFGTNHLGQPVASTSHRGVTTAEASGMRQKQLLLERQARELNY